jgi:hypothetical protein
VDERARGGSTASGELFYDGDCGEEIAAGTAVLLVDGQAADAELCELGEQLTREPVLSVPFPHAFAGHLVVYEAPDGLPQQRDVLRLCDEMAQKSSITFSFDRKKIRPPSTAATVVKRQ